jgi:hypothetical protein
MAAALEICFEMLEYAAVEGGECYSLSKSLQAMGELLFGDMSVLARRGLWPKAKTLSLLLSAAETAERLPQNTGNSAGGVEQHPFRDLRQQAQRLRRLQEELARHTEWPPVYTHVQG